MTGDIITFEKMMNEGYSAAWDKHWERASGFYRQALEEFPDHPQALTNLGLALFELRAYEEALVHFQRAVEAAPDDPLPHEKIARIYEHLGRVADAIDKSIASAELNLKTHNIKKAIENWQHAVSLQPENLDLRARLATVYQRMGRKDDTIAEYLVCASLLQHSGEIAKAMQMVDYVLQFYPESKDALQARSMLRAHQPLPKPARLRGGTAALRMADARQLGAPEQQAHELDQEPIAETRQQALVELAELLFQELEETDGGTQPQEGGAIGLQALGADKLNLTKTAQEKIQLHLGQAIESQTHGDDKRAVEELERIIDIGLAHPALFFDYGLLRASSHSQRALHNLQKSATHPAYALASYLLMAQIYQREQRYAQAAAAYLHALRQADTLTVPPDYADDLHQLYQPLIEEQTREKSDDYLKTLCEIISSHLARPDWRQYLMSARSQLPPQTGDSPPLPLAEMLLQLKSSEVVEALTRVRRLLELKLYRSALDEAFATIETAPTYLPLHVQIGDILLQMGNLPDAVTKFLTVAELYALRGETIHAINLLKRVLYLTPMEFKVHDRLIELLVTEGRIEEALQQTIAKADAYYHMAELDMTRQTYRDALRLAQQSKVDRSWSVKILYKIADIDLQSLDLRQALLVFEQIRTLEPEEAKARTQLVNLKFRLGQGSAALTEMDGFVALLEHGGKREAAIQFVKDLLEERPENLAILKRLADLYLRNGQLELGVKQLDSIAETLMAVGNREAAITVLNTIVALKPPNAAEYQAALDQLKSG